MNISHLIIRKVGKDDEQILLAESQFNIGTNEDCDVLIPGPGNTSFFSIFVFNNDLFIERE